MKTFDEALKARLMRRSPAEAQLCAEEVELRYGPIFQEIAENPAAIMLVQSIATVEPPEGVDGGSWQMSILVSLFANGVMIGMEMEKAE